MTKVLVCGGRDYQDHNKVYEQLNAALDHYGLPFVVIHGGAEGADKFAELWAASAGATRGAHSALVRARWSHLGKGAGHQRNAAMLALTPDFVLAFPGGTGTADMVFRARQAGVPVYVVS